MSDWDAPPQTYLFPEGSPSTSYGYAGTLAMDDHQKRKAREREAKKEAGEWPVGFVHNSSGRRTRRSDS
jgi:hypothetical protein